MSRSNLDALSWSAMKPELDTGVITPPGRTVVTARTTGWLSVRLVPYTVRRRPVRTDR